MSSLASLTQFRFVAVTVAVLSFHAAVSLAGECETKKAKAIGTAVRAYLKCFGKSDLSPSFDTTGCELAVRGKCTDGVYSAQESGSCLVVVNAYDFCVAEVFEAAENVYDWAYQGGGKCGLKQGKPLGTEVATYLKCVEEDLRDGTQDQDDEYDECVSVAHGKCASKYHRAQEGCSSESPLGACSDAESEADTLVLIGVAP